MGAKEFYSMEENKGIFHLVRWDHFGENFCKLKNGGFKKLISRGGRNANLWYIAKPILHKYITKGMITDEMDVKAIHPMNEFKEIDFERFKDNFKWLKKRMSFYLSTTGVLVSTVLEYYKCTSIQLYHQCSKIGY
eukprot:10482770-Ditylum_brightwellii.AAC.1